MINGILARVERPVQRQRIVPALVFAAGLLTANACVDVRGAAVELSWSIRTFAGTPVADCADARIARVQVRWTSAEAADAVAPGEPVPPDGFEEFECEANRGVTDFDIDAGRQLLSIRPICQSRDEPVPGTFGVPPAIVREVQSGEVVTLSSLLIVVETRCNGQPTGSENFGTCCPATLIQGETRGQGETAFFLP